LKTAKEIGLDIPANFVEAVSHGGGFFVHGGSVFGRNSFGEASHCIDFAALKTRPHICAIVKAIGIN
jgi:hypothetical protein